MAGYEGSATGARAGGGTRRAILALVATSLAIVVAVVLGGAGGGSCAPSPVSVTTPTPTPSSSTHHALAVGSTGAIRATANGGATWSAKTSGTTASLNDAAFGDASHGWAVGWDGYSGTIVATTNGGGTWTTQNAGSGLVLQCVAASDASRAWAVGDHGGIIATSDGGSVWSPQASATSESLEGVAFSDASHGWAVGFNGTIVATANGGTTWAPQSSGTTNSLNAVAFSDAAHGWAVGSDGTILATTNGGGTWAPQTSGGGADLFGVACSDATHAWAVGWDAFSYPALHGVVLATTDGGATWVTQVSGREEWLYDVAFSDATHGWAVGLDVSPSADPDSCGRILATSNGGATWAVQDSGFRALFGCDAKLESSAGAAASQAEPAAARGSVPALLLTWENGMTTTVYDVQNPEVASQPVDLQEKEITLAPSYGATPCFGFSVATSLIFSRADVAIPASALPSMGVAENRCSKLVAFSVSAAGAVKELAGTYDKATRTTTFVAETLSTTFVLATDTKKPVAKALANATVKRGKKASLRYKITEGRPKAVTTITIRKGKKVVKTLNLKARATNKSLVCSFTCKLAAGTYTWTVKAKDRLGNASKLTTASTKKLIVKR